eukprot:TRINITY_DN1323_c0_g1_i1.p2 TRINITY_DN1323_c0_g1~~TRINITY_DN1323_c0_g1_i1.p2  ORF type:complete len:111 (-),score=17.51 TRINITY_DN1323_c0_g1_i1:96-428(-)
MHANIFSVIIFVFLCTIALFFFAHPQNPSKHARKKKEKMKMEWANTKPFSLKEASEESVYFERIELNRSSSGLHSSKLVARSNFHGRLAMMRRASNNSSSLLREFNSCAS